MNAEVLAILKDTLICFKNGYNFADPNGFGRNQSLCSFWICNHIDYKMEVIKDCLYVNGEDAIKYIALNRPTETLFPEIYNGHGYDKSCKDDSFWFTPSHGNPGYIRDKVQAQKIKYLELLIAKLQSGFDISNVVKKKSNKPFKNGEHTDTIIGFTTNPNHPNNKIAAILKDSDTIVCLNALAIANNNI